MPQTPKLPLQPLPLLMREPVTLPGTAVTYELGLEMYKSHVAFGTTSMNSVTYSQTLTNLVHEISKRKDFPYLARPGTWNSFEQLPPAYEQMVIESSAFPIFRGNVGLRRALSTTIVFPADKIKYDKRVERRWTELFYTLIAECAGLAPKTFAAGFTVNYVPVSFVERGRNDLAYELEPHHPKEHGTKYALPLYELIRKASNFGFLIYDLKADNVLVMNDDTLKLIDLDAAHTLLVDTTIVSTSCLEFLNLFVFLCNFMVWVPSASSRTASKIVCAKLAEHLERLKVQDPQYSELCTLFLATPRQYSREDPKLPYLKWTASYLPQKLADRLLYMAGFYLGWLKDDSMGQYGVVAPFEYGEGATPIVEQIALRILKEMKIDLEQVPIP